MTKVTASFSVPSALIALATFGPIIGGCDQKEDPVNAAFQETVYGVREYKADAHSVYIKAPDGTLIKIVQSYRDAGHINVKKLVQFKVLKSAEGYAEYGAKGNIGGFGGGLDWSKGFVFKPINLMEALALFDNDWTKLAYPVYDQYSRLKSSVHPAFGNLCYVVCNPIKDKDASKMNFPNLYLGQFESGLTPKFTQEFRENVVDQDMFNKWVYGDSSIKRIAIRDSLPKHLYIRLDNNAMLRVTESSGKLVFGVTSSGYGVAGAEVSVPKFGFGGEVPTAFTYTQLEPLAILALIDNDWQRVVKAAERQSEIFNISVDPILVANTLKPLTEKNPGLKQLTIAHGRDEQGNYVIDPLDDKIGILGLTAAKLREVYPPQYFDLPDRQLLEFMNELLRYPPEAMDKFEKILRDEAANKAGGKAANTNTPPAPVRSRGGK